MWKSPLSDFENKEKGKGEIMERMDRREKRKEREEIRII